MRSRPLLTARFALLLLQTMGLSALVPIAGCGGSVLVEGGTNGNGGGAGDGGAGGGEPCTVQVEDGEVLKHVCFAQCPPEDGVSAAVAAEVEWDSCDEFCCTTVSMASQPCGPFIENDQCCFDVTTSSEEICMGRPFIVEDRARVASFALRDDWSDAAAPGEVDPDTRRALAEAWMADGLFEHASIASFARFTLELLAVGAPPDLVTAAQRAAMDEIAHARACFGLASAYGAEPRGPGALDTSGGISRHSLAEIAEAAAAEGCIGETLSAMCARAAFEEASDPAVRAALARIAEDEEGHAALAWRFVAWALAQGDAETTRRVRRVFAEAGASVSVDPLDGERVDPAAWRAHGRLTGAERASVFSRGLAEVVRPCAAALLAAAAKGAPRARGRVTAP
jgi:hypothetical protein